jgi:hypothetical protein
MTCHEFWNEMPELTGGGEQPDHARECPACAALLERQRALSAGLSRLSKETNPREAPGSVEARLVEAFRNQAGSRPRTALRHWLAWSSAAALIIVSILLTVERRAGRTRPPDVQAISRFAVGELADLDSDFIPLPYGTSEQVGADAADDPDLVRVEVPRSALVALGLPVSEGGSARVEAVVALGADGMLEGIRIVQ